jgi:hypothetical protein
VAGIPEVVISLVDLQDAGVRRGAALGRGKQPPAPDYRNVI